MDLFNKKLSLEESLQFDSMIDNGHYDPHLVLLTTMMSNPEYVPSSEQSKNIMQHIQGNKPVTTEPKPDTTESKPDTTDNTETKTDKIENKKHSKTYIKLPNATIKLHKHKFKQSENEGNIKSNDGK